MKKLILILLAVVTALSFFGWMHGRRLPSSVALPTPKQNKVATPEEPPKKEKPSQENTAVEGDSDREPAYLILPVWYAMKEEAKTARPGYWDSSKKTLYAWKEVLVLYEEIPGIAAPSGIAPLDITKIRVVEIDPPVFYLQQADDSFVPGYYSGWEHLKEFYEWKGVTLKRKQIPDMGAKKRLLKKTDALAVRTIKAPDHRLREPRTWKKE